MVNWEKIRADFPALKRKVHGKPLVYLDNAATTQKPTQVLQAIQSYYQDHNANIHRAVHQLSQEATELYDQAHIHTAKFLGAKNMQEIIFTKNASEALNLAAYSLVPSLNKGDEIVTTITEHHSNFVPWQQLAKQRGITMRYVDVNDNQELDQESLDQSITKKTKIVAVGHVSNATGVINDIKTIAKHAHEHDALCVVDSAQGVPHLPVNVKKLNVDLFACSAHKMFGPTGIGVLYGKQDVLEDMNPFLYGGDMIAEVSTSATTYNDLPWKFEAGTPNVAGGAGMLATVEYLQTIGMDNIKQREDKLTTYTQKRFDELQGVTLYGATTKRAAVFSFTVDGVHPHDVATVLDAQGIAVRSGHHCAMPLMENLGVQGTVRASFHVYNTEQEADKLIQGIEQAQKTFQR